MESNHGKWQIPAPSTGERQQRALWKYSQWIAQGGCELVTKEACAIPGHSVLPGILHYSSQQPVRIPCPCNHRTATGSEDLLALWSGGLAVPGNKKLKGNGQSPAKPSDNTSAWALMYTLGSSVRNGFSIHVSEGHLSTWVSLAWADLFSESVCMRKPS